MTQLDELLKEPTKLLAGHGVFIDGKRISRSSGGAHAHINPATGKVQAEVSLAGAQEIDQAVASARAALPVWRGLPANERGRILFRFADLLQAAQPEIAVLAALESGVPVAGGGGMVLAQAWIRYYAGWADKLEGQVVSSYPMPGFDYILPEPYGVIGVIIPWNMPSVATAMKVIPALAAGNTVVLKPPEITPFVALRMAELALEAGLPPGAFNVAPGTGEAGARLVAHPGVDKITFTGGGATARRIMASAAEALKPLAFELGGKSANLIFADANLDAAVPQSVGGCLGLSGQGCVNPTRMLVEESIYDQVAERVRAVVGAIRLGLPLDLSTSMGPVINEAACTRILGVIERAKSERAGELIAGGSRAGGTLAEGYFIEPTVFGRVDPASHLSREEVFGPVLAISTFRDEADALAKANDSVYGLGAYLHTRDIGRAHRLAGQLEAGSVYVNSGMPNMSPTAPFGGVKTSGFGREGGRAGIEEFIRPKSVFIATQG
ncbi:MAG: aldehyde dehydrogenase [Caulobacteraceae bacterium]|nr:aldehyde dehydrogenase [Caulobacteraceae bacterium]